jgi:hypothetical protein
VVKRSRNKEKNILSHLLLLLLLLHASQTKVTIYPVILTLY